MTDAFAALCAGVTCFGAWGCVAGPAAWLAHRRVRSVERVHRTAPRRETALLFYAGASSLYFFALVLTAVGLFRRDWVRLGRDCLLIFIAHMTALIGGAMVVALSSSSPHSRADLAALVGVSCTVVGVSFLITGVLLWQWAGVRAAGLEAASSPTPSSSPGPDGPLDMAPIRWLVYLASLAFWPIGVILPLVLSSPRYARVGAYSFRWSLVVVGGLGIVTCIGLAILAGSMA